MNGIHDLGGMHGLGQIEREANEPVFHNDWERKALAISNLAMAAGVYNVDEIRHAIERIPPLEYLATSYYEHWVLGFEDLFLQKGIYTEQEYEARLSEFRSRR